MFTISGLQYLSIPISQTTPSTFSNPQKETHISLRRLPHLLNITLPKLPVQPRTRHTARQRPHRHLLRKPQRRHRALPIHNVLTLHLDQRHARILRRAGVDAVAQVAEPGAQAGVIELLDARVRVGHGGGFARDAGPVLRGAVLERDLACLGVLEVGELLGVLWPRR